MRPFEYLRPVSLDEACRLFAATNKKDAILAGGTDLLVQIKKGEMIPERVISLRDIPNLSNVRLANSGLVIGAMTPIYTIEEHPDIKQSFPAITEAAKQIGSSQIRNRATIGGNLCNGAPSADMVPALLIHDASLVITSKEKDRTIPLKDFFIGPGQTHLKPGEILKEIQVPISSSCFSTYLKACRSRMDIALVGVGFFLSFNQKKQIFNKIRIALGAVAPTPLLIDGLEEMISDSIFDDIVIDRIVYSCIQKISPITDVRATAGYRNELTRVLIRRALWKVRKWHKRGMTA